MEKILGKQHFTLHHKKIIDDKKNVWGYGESIYLMNKGR